MAGVLGRDQWNSGWRIVNFNQWFTIATFQIAVRELPKIRNELENHVLDAIQTHQQTGLSRFEVEEQAVLELGDPVEANRVMKQTYLTANDVKKVNQPIPVTPRLFGLFLLFVVGLFIHSLYRQSWNNVLIGVMCLVNTSTLYFCSSRVSRISNFALRYRVYLSVQLFSVSVSFFASIGLYFVNRGTPYEGGWLPFIVVFFGILVWQLRGLLLIRKLQARA
jgi:hypothetical protein